MKFVITVISLRGIWHSYMVDGRLLVEHNIIGSET